MKTLESFSVLKSVGNGIFSEVSTVEMYPSILAS